MNMNKILLGTLTVSLLVAGTTAQEMNAYPMSGERQVTGLFFWDGQSSPGNLAIAYGQPEWKAEYDELIEAGKPGAVRLGAGYWTTLDTCIDLTFGGIKVPAGMYYLGINRDEKGAFQLMCLDAATVRAQKKSPMETSALKAKINVPLTHNKVEDEANLLTITVTPNAEKNGGTFKLHWGTHELAAKIVVDLQGGTVPAALKKEAEKAAGAGVEEAKKAAGAGLEGVKKGAEKIKK